VSTAIEVFDRGFAKVRKSLLQLVQLVTGEDIIFAGRTPCHDRTILAASPIVRLTQGSYSENSPRCDSANCTGREHSSSSFAT